MKNALTYGFGTAVASSLLTLVLFFLGYHNDLEKMASGTAQVLGSLAWVILIVGMTLAIRTRREDSQDGSLTYGQGVGAGALTAVFTAVFSTVFTVLYATAINPDFIPKLREQQQAAMLKTGMSQAQIDQAASIMEMMISPVAIAVIAAFSIVLTGVIIALIAAAFLKRAAPAPTFDPPPLQE